MNNNSPFLVEIVVTIEQVVVYYIISKMICRRVASLTSYVCVEMDSSIPGRITHLATWQDYH
jgi:hypothetical protein